MDVEKCEQELLRRVEFFDYAEAQELKERMLKPGFFGGKSARNTIDIQVTKLLNRKIFIFYNWDEDEERQG